MPDVRSCVNPVWLQMSKEEKGLLYLILLHGKKLNEAIGEDAIRDSSVLEKWGERAGLDEIVTLINAAMLSGIGIMDGLSGRYDDYGRQLEYVIETVLLKALGATRPIFKEGSETLPGALQRERWVCEKLMEAMWDRLPDEMKREIAKEIEKLLEKSGIDKSKASRATAGILTGGLTAARTVLGFQFHIFLAQFANLLVRALSGAGIVFLGNAVLQRFAGLFFGPAGWIISLVLLVPTITGWLVPRELDKYLPAVFLIGLKRMEQTE